MVKKMPERIIADHQAAIGQLLEQSPQREIRLLGDPRQNPIPLARHKVRPVAAHFQRRRTANGALSLRPLHNAGDADHERLGHRPAGLARRHSPNHPLPQVQRIGSRHPSWPPIKSQQVESDSRPFANPLDSVNPDRALGGTLMAGLARLCAPVALGLLTVAAAPVAGAPAAQVTLAETGSTLIYPVFRIWAADYPKTHP